MGSRILERHRRWSARDQRARLAEGGARIGAGAACLAALWGWQVLPSPLLAGLVTGLLAAEAVRFRIDRRTPEQVAAHIDRAAGSEWLMQTALSLVQDPPPPPGDPEIRAALLARAERLAERADPIATRPREWPRPWLAAAGLALASLLFRPPAPLLSDPLGSRPALAEAQADPQADLPPGAAEPDRLREPEDRSPAGLAAAAADGGVASGSRTSAEGAANQGAAAVSDRGGASEGPDSSRAGTGGGRSEASAELGEPPEQEPDDEPGAGAMPPGTDMTMNPSTGGDSPSAGTVEMQQRAYADAGDGEGGGDGEMLIGEEGGVGSEAAEDDGMSRKVEGSGAASQLTDPEGEHADSAQAPTSPSTMPDMGEGAPTIASQDDDKIWDPITAGAGQGGKNDAAAIDRGVTAGERDEVAVAEEWVDSRWRAAPEGVVQAIEEGRSGGQSGIAYEEVFLRYAEIAEAAAGDDALPPGRRDYIRRYFEAIRPPGEPQQPGEDGE